MSTLSSAPARSAESQALQSPWTIDFAGPRGVSVSYRGVPVIRRSSLYVVKPGWAGLLYDQRSQSHELQKQPDGSLRVTAGNEEFRAEYELRPLDAQNLEVRFRGELRKDVPAQIELAAGYFNANLISNRPFHAVMRPAENGVAAADKSGVVPSFPATASLAQNDLAPGFSALQFDSRIGRLRIESSSRVVFSDARRDEQTWAKEAPVFWLGWMAGMQPLRFGQPVEMTVKIRIEPLDAAKPATAARAPLAFRAEASRAPDALSSRGRPLQVVPQPKTMRVEAGRHFALRDNLKWSVVAPQGETRLQQALQRLLRDEWNVSLRAPRVLNNSDSGGWSGLRIGDDKPISFPKTKPAWAQHADAYHLTVDKNGAQIVALSPRGVFYGLQTLAQLLRPDDKKARVAFVHIEDWPSLEFRGAHWFPSQSGVPFHKKLIGVMARHKFNYAVIQCEAARWDSHPEIAAPNSISKADLRELVQWCRAHFIEPIPLINVPGHAEWMFRNKQNLDLAEDPQTPYAYAVNNPKSLEFVRQILGEAIEVFQPKIFHLGHDEVTIRGRFPNPENPFYRPGQSATDLVMGNLRTLHDWLATQRIQSMVWGDMFLHKDEGVDAAHAPSVEEAKKRRALLPRDVIVADWHYGGNEKYPSLNLFAAEGIKTVGATWHTPQNVRNFARAAIEAKSWGLLQTTWAGYFPDATTVETEFRQFTAFVLAGDYSWSGRSEAPDKLPYDVVAQWSSTYAPQKGGEKSGALFDLSPASRVAPKNWLGLGEGWDLSGLFAAPDKVASNKAVTRRLDDVAFRLPSAGLAVLSAAPGDLAPAGALEKLTVETQRRAAQISLLHATLWNVPNGVTAARLTVEYADGTRAETDFIAGRSIVSWQSEGVAANARRGWSSVSPAGTPLGLRVTHWENPHPQKEIARLHFSPVDAEAGYVLAGLTFVD